MMTIESNNILGAAGKFLDMHKEQISRLALWLVIVPAVIVAFDGTGMAELGSMNLFEQISLSLGSTEGELMEIEYATGTARTPLFMIAHIWLTIGTLVLPGMVFLYLYKHYEDTYESNTAIMREYFYKIPKLFWTWLLLVICLVCLFILLVIPGLIFVVYRVLAIQVVLATGLYGMAALRHAKKLVQGRRWETLGTMVLIAIVVALLTIPLHIQQVAIWQWQGWNPWSDLISTLGRLILVVYSALCYGMMYLSWTESYEEQLANADDDATEEVSPA